MSSNCTQSRYKPNCTWTLGAWQFSVVCEAWNTEGVVLQAWLGCGPGQVSPVRSRLSCCILMALFQQIPLMTVDDCWCLCLVDRDSVISTTIPLETERLYIFTTAVGKMPFPSCAHVLFACERWWNLDKDWNRKSLRIVNGGVPNSKAFFPIKTTCSQALSPLVMNNIAIENGHLQWVFPWTMVIFQKLCQSLPEA